MQESGILMVETNYKFSLHIYMVYIILEVAWY